MTHIAVLGSTNMDLVAYVAKARAAAASPSVRRVGASSSMPYRSEIDAQAASNNRHSA
ncbi:MULTISPECIES: hypothetical protein [Streptomyces]|jgi:sugar/nucleoside kinase (ribokinase family)|uniref:hypothetical protein n=1 Tax=Streptomyces TaxID=1883 RepID=UPI000BCD1B82|nr:MULTISPECIES: hypothetical protein [Streptomyces]MCX4433157.1 hypothetical protein [Streptomyces mirabilis]PBC99732.1 hypothetical protein BX281_7843 [Streptomyces sp. Ag82_O1-15]SOE76490.1 hypothetical protein SAMN05446589_6354 [Streptomyces sp. OV198]